MFNCKQVSRLVSESLDRKLPFWTRMQLSMHLGMCGLCAQFRRTMIRVDEEVKRIDDSKLADSKLSEIARERIRQKIDQQQSGE